MSWIHPLSPRTEEPASVLGGKAHGLITLLRLGLPVPPGFVITTAACRAFLSGRRLPRGLDTELAVAVADLEAATGLRFGDPTRPLAVSVRSGARVPMPGMMRTILNLGLAARSPGEAARQLAEAVETVLASWNTPRAAAYRRLHGLPHDDGTAVTVQAMVFGDRDDRSGSGVAFSRDPNTGEPEPYGEVMFGRQGDDVVSGTAHAEPLHALAEHQPAVWTGLCDALARAEGHYRDACHLEFTFEAGGLWLLQVRAGGLSGPAAVRVAVDLADAGLITRGRAVLRVSPQHLRDARTPRLAPSRDVLIRGLGACPGVATGRVATTADRAARMAADGPVLLVRPHTSPQDMHGLAAAAGILTARGGPTSHAAVVARSLGKPAVVGAAGLTFTATGVHAAGHPLSEDTILTIDGTSGTVVAGQATLVTAPAGPHLHRLLGWAGEVTGDPQ
jgi:pyruvate, orthophosphate dikinase